MIRLALSFLLGVLIFQTSRTLPPYYIVVGFPAVAILYFYFPRGRYVYCVLLGFLWAFVFASTRLLPALDPLLEGEDLHIAGEVVEINKKLSNFSSFVFQTDQSSDSEPAKRLPKKINLSWYYPAQEVDAGQHCRFQVRLKRHWSFANPGSVDREKLMFLKGIGARGYVRAGQCRGLNPHGMQKSVRLRLIDQFQRQANKYAHSGLMQALSFGVRDDIENSQWEVLRATGTSHLLAISGLHLSAICLVVFLITTSLAKCSATICARIPAQCVGAVFAMMATVMYAYLAGFSVPTQRALIMVFVALGAILLRKPVVQFSLLATALLAVLLWNPLTVLSASFWMSFSAVLFIFVILKSSLGCSKITKLIRIQILLAVALLPVSMWFFSQGSLIAPIVNLLAVPYVSFLLLPVLLLGKLLFLMGVEASHYMFIATDYLLAGLQWWLQICTEVPFAAVQFHPTIYGVILFELGLLLLIQPRGIPVRLLSMVFIAALFFMRDDALTEDQLRVTMLDVGQGSAVVVETKNHALVYDTGPKYASGFNTGTAVVLPYLKTRNIKRVDRLVVSHNDNDHAGGAQSLLEAGIVKNLMISNDKHKFSADVVEYCKKGDEWDWDGVNFRILHPPKYWQSSSNNRSCVVQITHSAGTILLVGDIEETVERRLIAEYGDKLRSLLLLVPHHGSSSSSSRRFLARVRPQTAVFSVGYRNRYGFPHANITARYQSIGAELVDTIREGAVTFIFDSRQGMHREVGYRPSSRRYWNSTWEHSIDPG